MAMEIKYEDGFWILEDKKLGIISYGEDFGSAFCSYDEDLLYLWDEIGREEDNKLDGKAQKLKALLLKVRGRHK
ncbi:MAG: hypothetical protein J7L26_04710 [Candidatus Aminicenantes bacterium]|nr:hypothetical protein [Candidatus Aminicenantes bacterium]